MDLPRPVWFEIVSIDWDDSDDPVKFEAVLWDANGDWCDGDEMIVGKTIEECREQVIAVYGPIEERNPPDAD